MAGMRIPVLESGLVSQRVISEEIEKIQAGAQDGAAVRREVQPRLCLAGRCAGLDLLDLLADDPLADQAGLEDGNAHASHATSRYPGTSTLDFH